MRESQFHHCIRLSKKMNTNFILERKFQIIGMDDNVVGEVSFKISIGGDYFDPIRTPPAKILLEIFGGGLNISREELGVDPIQAVSLALTIGCGILYSSDLWKSGKLKWLGSRDLGLPLQAGYDRDRRIPPWDD